MIFLRSFERTLDIEGSKESVGQYGGFCREAALFNKSRHLTAISYGLEKQASTYVCKCAQR